MIGSLFSWVVDKIWGGGAIETLQKQLSHWEEYAASAPEQGGIRQRLRDWRNAVRGWMGGTAAVVRGWLGSPGVL